MLRKLNYGATREGTKNKSRREKQKAKRVKVSAEANGSGRSWGKRKGKAHEEDMSDGSSEKWNGAKRNGAKPSQEAIKAKARTALHHN